MPAYLSLDSLSLAAPDGRILLDDLTLPIGDERTAIVGRNGSGKTTLLDVMAGVAQPRGGSVARTGTVAIMAQGWPDPAASGGRALGIADDLARLERLDAGRGDAQDAADADWTLPERLGAALDAVGLDMAIIARPIETMSGGERTRLAVAQVTLSQADLLLLDEPTNNLDREGRRLIADLIAGWRGGVVLASHDRSLLEQVDRIITLERGGAEIFGGGWNAYVAHRDAARARAAAELDRADREVRAVARAVQQQRERKARRDKAGRAWRVKGVDSKMFLDAEKGRAERSAGRDNHLAERLVEDAAADHDAARRRVEVLTPIAMHLPPSGLPAARRLLAIEAATLRRGDRSIFGPLSFEVRGPERLALRGPNGAGKSSVFAMIRGLLLPSAGTVAVFTDRIATLDQHIGLLAGDEIILANHRLLHPDLSEHASRAALARFGFRNRAVDQRAGTLSGGERIRAGLACVMGGDAAPELLLLDEPTNHLDAEAVEVLEAALRDYDGAIIVASHDEAFIDAVGIERTIEIR